MKKLKILIILALLAGAGYYSYIYYFEEYGLYKEAMSPGAQWAAEHYIYKYPEGRWIEEVQEQFVYNEYLRVKRSMEINDIRTFRKVYPDSKYDEQLVTWSDSLWNQEINHYERISKEQGTDPKSAEFFRSLMNYMRDNHQSTVFVRFDPNIRLKDFTEYSTQAQNFLDEDARSVKDPIISENMLSLKQNFDLGSASELETIVDKGISASMDNVFEQKIIYVGTWNDEFQEKYPDAPIINVKYNIANNEFRYGNLIFPDVWTYTIGNSFQTYVLGISIDFSFDFSIPGTSERYTFKSAANPGRSLTNLKDVKDAYRTMTRVTFQNYADEISGKFGLSKVEQEG